MILEKTLRYTALGGIFLLPFICLYIATNLYFPFITGKNFAFRILVEISAAAWLALALIYPRYRPRREWVLGAFALFVLLIAIADAQGVYPFKSFWSNFERMDGWVTLAHLLAYIAVAVSMLDTRKLWRRLFQTTLGVSLFVGLYGLMQLMGFVSLNPGFSSVSRIDATFGNPIYLAVYALFHVFIAGLLWYEAWQERGVGKRTGISWYYGLAAGLNVLVLFLTGTRGTMLGLIGGGLLTLFILAVFKASSRIRIAAALAVVLVIVLGFALKTGKDTTFVKSVGFLDRLASISLSDRTIEARFLNMGIAWQGVKERPVFGWGQENYAIVFDKYYDPRMFDQEPWFDRVHDIIFDWWIAGGTLGLLSYFSIFAAAMWVLWRSQAFALVERALLTGLLAGYFVHNLTVFDNVTSYILFATILAYIAWRGSDAANKARLFENYKISETALPFVAGVVALCLLGVSWYANAAAIAQNRALIGALPQYQEGVLKNLEYFEKAISYGSVGTQEAREQLSQAATQIVAAESLDIATKQKYFEAGVTQMQEQEKASPLDARFPLFLGILFNAAGDLDSGAKALQRALELSPKKQNIMFTLGQNALARGKNDEAIALFKQAYDLAPTYKSAQIAYAAAAIRAAQDQIADQVLAPLISGGGAADPQITAAYVARKRYDKLIPIWNAYVAAHPEDPQGYFTLAGAYYGLKQNQKAIDALNKAIEVAPQVKTQAEDLIKQIRSGTAAQL